MSAMPNIKAAVPGAVRTMRWEYMTLSYNYSYGTTTYEINGEKENRLKNKPLQESLTIFGQQGWELVGIAGAEGKLYVMKRPMTKPAASTNGNDSPQTEK